MSGGTATLRPDRTSAARRRTAGRPAAAAGPRILPQTSAACGHHSQVTASVNTVRRQTDALRRHDVVLEMSRMEMLRRTSVYG